MPSYWWKCTRCGEATDFGTVTSSRGIAHYIWDVLIPSKWDQSCLTLQCKKCKTQSLKITYEFPRAERVELTLIHAVGISPADGSVYVPMMWETKPDSSEREHWIDFKYINGRSVFGLNKAAVFTRVELHTLLAKFKEATGQHEFPSL